MSWIEKIPGCFDGVDILFAGHALDEKRAKELRKELIKAGVSWDDVEKEFREFQEGQDVHADQMAEQMMKVEKFFRLKLSKSNR